MSLNDETIEKETNEIIEEEKQKKKRTDSITLTIISIVFLNVISIFYG
jgi:hypothetical protein